VRLGARLVLGPTDEMWVNINYGRHIAEKIPGATLIELPGTDHYPWEQNADAVVGEIEELLTGEQRSRLREACCATVDR
jgi:pimeloyl-ACP methyl ester carboxylesterase